MKTESYTAANINTLLYFLRPIHITDLKPITTSHITTNEVALAHIENKYLTRLRRASCFSLKSLVIFSSALSLYSNEGITYQSNISCQIVILIESYLITKHKFFLFSKKFFSSPPLYMTLPHSLDLHQLPISS